MRQTETIVEYLCSGCGTQGTQSLDRAEGNQVREPYREKVFCPKCGKKAFFIRSFLESASMGASRL
ncbi:MAG: hypothetical protein AB1445_03075 [Bacillota bacterium]